MRPFWKHPWHHYSFPRYIIIIIICDTLAQNKAAISVAQQSKNSTTTVLDGTFELPNEKLAAQFYQSMLQLGAKEQDKGLFKSMAEDKPGITSPKTPMDRLLLLPVAQWSIEDVQLWLTLVYFSDNLPMFNHVGDILLQNEINGKALLQLEDEQLFSMGIKKLGYVSTLKEYIKRAPRKSMKYCT